jgi:hypothetical protein
MMGISFFQAQVEELTTFQVLRLRDFSRNERNEREMSAQFITMLSSTAVLYRYLMMRILGWWSGC